MGAAPIGIPGCPEFAFWTISTDNILIVLIQSSSRFFISLFFNSFNTKIEIGQVVFIPNITRAANTPGFLFG
jgi:hypothetical protein